MAKIEVDHDSFACRQEDAFAILKLKKRAQEVLTTVQSKEDLMALLSEAQYNPDIKGLALIYSGEYLADKEYKRFIDGFLEEKIDVGKWRYGQRYMIALRQFLEIVLNFSVPIVTGMDGNIGPDSFGLSLASDFRLATEGTQFVNPNVRLGLPPSGILSFFLVKNIGPAKAV